MSKSINPKESTPYGSGSGSPSTSIAIASNATQEVVVKLEDESNEDPLIKKEDVGLDWDPLEHLEDFDPLATPEGCVDIINGHWGKPVEELLNTAVCSPRAPKFWDFALLQALAQIASFTSDRRAKAAEAIMLANRQRWEKTIGKRDRQKEAIAKGLPEPKWVNANDVERALHELHHTEKLMQKKQQDAAERAMAAKAAIEQPHLSIQHEDVTKDQKILAKPANSGHNPGTALKSTSKSTSNSKKSISKSPPTVANKTKQRKISPRELDNLVPGTFFHEHSGTQTPPADGAEIERFALMCHGLSPHLPPPDVDTVDSAVESSPSQATSLSDNANGKRKRDDASPAADRRVDELPVKKRKLSSSSTSSEDVARSIERELDLENPFLERLPEVPPMRRPHTIRSLQEHIQLLHAIIEAHRVIIDNQRDYYSRKEEDLASDGRKMQEAMTDFLSRYQD
ncbi:hypothetical protein EJ05DRAFT_283595 [Pseudovirgaria hyperparasitica]|uniref:Uncharacterized protein n=1 Tax=Pseudovirgaria hyperparasitica TaxID=470096 RepID=A0A6A6WEV0_9PEZI|nr:uncharacterized protein EJ05DRAFT_283595 [Pseudovirgaria hyperparasitica]KAF2760416.1 hypothetical protein EJ05DRAFT_283595 [Pseudovirgaria hyperparasitica]